MCPAREEPMTVPAEAPQRQHLLSTARHRAA
jgi:hypothetical protein